MKKSWLQLKLNLQGEKMNNNDIILDTLEKRLKYFKFEKMLRDRERAIHKMKNGEYIKLVDMSDEHLDKAIKFFEQRRKKIYNTTKPSWA